MRTKFIAILLGLTLLITGCNADQQMPKEMPGDFGFYVHYGIDSKNVIDSFNGLVVKDLIAAGTAGAKISFTKEELHSIYDQMVKINILEAKELINDTSCKVTPHGEDYWIIQLDGLKKSLHWSGEYCDSTEDIEQLIELRKFVVNIVKEKEAYMALPETEGAYQ